MFGDIVIEKWKFHRYKNLIFQEDVVIDNKISFGDNSYKFFIGYMNDDYENKPLFIMLPKTSAYVKSYDNENKWMNFLIKDDDFLMIFEKRQ